MSVSRAVFSTCLLVAALVLMHTGPVHMNSDPSAMFCEPVCWDEDARAEQCMRRRVCDPEALGQAEFAKCSDECYSRSAGCRRHCSESLDAILDVCSPNCTDPERYQHCVGVCFTDRALALKHRQRWATLGEESDRSRSRRMRRMRNLLRGMSGFRGRPQSDSAHPGQWA